MGEKLHVESINRIVVTVWNNRFVLLAGTETLPKYCVYVGKNVERESRGN